MRLALLLAAALAGCAKGQSATCRKMIACTEAITAGAGAAMETAYGKDAVCWKTPEAAETCNHACEDAMKGLAGTPSFAKTPACQ